MTRLFSSSDGPVKQHEIEPGRSVPNHWRDDGPHLLERYADRKARKAAEARARFDELVVDACETGWARERAQRLSRRQLATAETQSGFGGDHGR